MKKTLIALAIMGAAAGVANAQSNVVIYGVVDTGFIKENGSDTRMGSNIDNRIGFRGTERWPRKGKTGTVPPMWD